MAPSREQKTASRTRSRLGCMNCRKRKKKCDEVKPTCSSCMKASQRCQWIRPLSFRNEYTTSQPVRGSSSENSSLETSHLLGHDSCENNHLELGTNGDHNNLFVPRSPPAQRQLASTSLYSSAKVMSPVDNSTLDFREESSLISSPMDSPSSVVNFHRSLEQSFNNSHIASPYNTIEALAAVPQASMVPSAENVGIGMSGSHPQCLPAGEYNFQLSPATTDDGIFLPGSKYHELHNTLRDHVFYSTRSAAVSRQATPPLDTVPMDPGDCISAPLSQPKATLPHSGDPFDDFEHPISLTHSQEYILWNNWVTEISSWLDKMDGSKHFRHTIPTLAKDCVHLRYSMLALSARQLERKDGSLPADMSLALYQAAIHHLVPQLHDKDVRILASCVIVCVLEMQSCSPRAWRRHLDGCACLIRAMNIRGDSGGVEQALFWCFARMDMCGGLISQEKTLIPINEWMTPGSLDGDKAAFQTSDAFEVHAQYSCYLVGTVLAFLASEHEFEGRGSRARNERQHPYMRRWHEIFDCLEDWYTKRPPEMLPLLFQPVNRTATSTESPFPTVLFSNAAAISGNQLYHTAALLMLQEIPAKVPKKPRSALWHARQICAIAISNADHGCWTNSVQPLWLAGQLMSHHDEHNAIIKIFERIEKETGWGATWRADDLKKHWGDLDD